MVEPTRKAVEPGHRARQHRESAGGQRDGDERGKTEFGEAAARGPVFERADLIDAIAKKQEPPENVGLGFGSNRSSIGQHVSRERQNARGTIRPRGVAGYAE